MTVTSALLTYLVAAVVLAVTPGMDTALVIRTGTVEGPRRAMAAALGVTLGCLAWGGAVAAGLGVLLVASQLGFAVLKWVGAGYLFYLGGKLLFRPRERLDLAETGSSGSPTGESTAAVGAAGGSSTGWLARGFLTNLLNPKVGVFYVSFLPQFVPPGVAPAPFLFLLAAIHAVIALVWFAILTAALVPLSKQLRKPAVVRWLDRATGGLFVAFGVRLALTQRP
ncbi:MAG: LysE family translocator [Polyangiaceae bacterium]